MLYGNIESPEDRVDHLIRLREQQDKSGGFQCFIPLAFYPPDTQMAHLPGPSGVDSLKTMAVSRLMLDNFAHIKAYWVMLGKRLAQVALHFGANDVDGTITEGGELTESYSVESNNEVRMTKPELLQLAQDVQGGDQVARPAQPGHRRAEQSWSQHPGRGRCTDPGRGRDDHAARQPRRADVVLRLARIIRFIQISSHNSLT